MQSAAHCQWQSVVRSALADTYRKFLEVAYTDIKVVVNGKPTTPRDSDGTPVKPFISSGTTYLPVRSISNALGQNVDWGQ